LAVGVGEIGFHVGTRILESCSLEPSTLPGMLVGTRILESCSLEPSTLPDMLVGTSILESSFLEPSTLPGMFDDTRLLESSALEPSTLPGMLDGIGMRDCDLVLMDKGISQNANLEPRESTGIRYLVAATGSKS
ncbi:MAG: hypothetical protein LBR80_10280, partial [Deltaproteobacteria bacterium]|nr:hypothetical protein [Deltaproteobacteria bacterium]